MSWKGLKRKREKVIVKRERMFPESFRQVKERKRESIGFEMFEKVVEIDFEGERVDCLFDLVG